MNSKNTLNNTLKGILTVALIGALTAGCGKKANDEAGNNQAERPAEGLQDADTAVIGSDGSVTILDEAGNVVEEVPRDAESVPETVQQAEEALPVEQVIGGNAAPAGSTSGSGTAEGSGNSSTSGSSESSVSETPGGSETAGGTGSEEGSGETSETPDPNANAKDTGGF